MEPRALENPHTVPEKDRNLYPIERGGRTLHPHEAGLKPKDGAACLLQVFNDLAAYTSSLASYFTFRHAYPHMNAAALISSLDEYLAALSEDNTYVAGDHLREAVEAVRNAFAAY